VTVPNEMKKSNYILTKMLLFHEIIESECYVNEIFIKKDRVKEAIIKTGPSAHSQNVSNLFIRSTFCLQVS